MRKVAPKRHLVFRVTETDFRPRLRGLLCVSTEEDCETWIDGVPAIFGRVEGFDEQWGFRLDGLEPLDQFTKAWMAGKLLGEARDTWDGDAS